MAPSLTTLPMTAMVAIVVMINNRSMNTPIGSLTQTSFTPMTVTIFMIKIVAPTAQDVLGLGLEETLQNGGQAMQSVAVRPRRPSFGVQAVQISMMGSVELTAQNAAKHASLTILTQRRSAAARLGNSD